MSEKIWEVPQGTIPQMPNYPGRGSAVAEANHRGIPSVFFEIGGEGKLVKEHVDFACDALKNVMKSIGMLEGEPVVVEPTVYSGGNVLFAQRGGLHFINIKSGDLVYEGQELGYTIDWNGDVIHRDICPCNGLMTNMVAVSYTHLDVYKRQTWPCTWFAPRTTGEGAFKTAYDVMNNWGANHGAISYGHIGADLITMCSMLRIPVAMHNVPDDKIFRPASWNAFGMDKEGQDFRACAAYGPQFKLVR